MAATGSRGGKHPKIDAYGYFGTNTAGDPMKMGKSTRPYTFYSKIHGYLTIWATSYEDAWRQAKERGYQKQK